MALRAVFPLHKAGWLRSKGETQKAAAILDSAIERGVSDPRLQIQKAAISRTGPEAPEKDEAFADARAALLFSAINALANGDYSTAEENSAKVLETSPDNFTASAARAVAILEGNGGIEPLLEARGSLENASSRVRALALYSIERAIASLNPSDSGAAEKEDVTGGLFGALFDVLDDLAVWIYWLISIALNLAINALEKETRAVYWRIIEGDRLEGLRKDERAIEQYKAALELSPINVEALESMVKHSTIRKEYGPALEYLDKLKAAAGKEALADLSIMKWDADIAFFTRNLEKAEELYQKLAQGVPLNYISFYRLGLCAMARRDKAGAVGYFEQALSNINPGLLPERADLLAELVRKKQNAGDGAV